MSYHNNRGILNSIRGKIIVAGPCSAENEKQIAQTSLEIGKHGATAIRAGIWKPRTQPGTFEGVGAKGLKWLKKAGKVARLPVTTEVANAEHVDQCLENGIDLLWIGARTTTSPFAVQAIADALKGVDIPVLVKNPVNPDIKLWIGAIERFMKAGVCKLIAVHRGFSIYEKSKYRNPPLWRIPIELRRLMPDVKMLCDPSHICGNASLIEETAQEAMDLMYDGLMMEVHVNPKKALSDSEQQLTPLEYGRLINNLQIKKGSNKNRAFLMKVKELRKEIDEIDEGIISMLSRRMKIVREIGEHKRNQLEPILQMDRWREVLANSMKIAESLDVSPKCVQRIYEEIHIEALEVQKRMLKSPLQS